jgi:hypothetical protein
MPVSEETLMKSEERRALVLLGITAVLASFLATMYALIWTGMKKEGDFWFNFPCDAVGHLTVLDVPLLRTLIGAWITYAFFTFFYFSEDWLSNRKVLRNFCHVVAAVSMGFYFLFVVWSIPVDYILIVWIPSQFGALYYSGALIGLGYIEFRFVELATDSKGLYKKVYWEKFSRPILIRFAHVAETKIRGGYGDRVPKNLRNRLIWLRRSIHEVRESRKLRGRVRLQTVFLLIVAILLAVGLSLFRVYCGFFI